MVNVAAGLLDSSLDKGQEVFNNVKLNLEDIYTYTFEAPQGANVNSKTIKAPKDAIYGNIWNIINPNDIVTKVAMSEYGFTRFGTDKFITTEFFDPSNFDNNRRVFKALHDVINQTDEFVYRGDNFEMHGLKVEDFLKKYNQTLVLNYYNKATNENKEKIQKQLRNINLDSLNNLYRISKINASAEIDKNTLYNLQYTDKSLLSDEYKKEIDDLGIEVIKENKYAVVTMAGGQGTRLGHNGPKGTFLLDVKPKPKSLFEILADSLKENNKKYGITLNWYIMTSEDNNEQTINFFKEHNYFDYPKNHIKFFKQGNMPLLNEDGKLVIDENGCIKYASNGNGAVFKAMKNNGILEDMKQKNIEWVFIGAVDNAILNMVDETLLGLTIKEKNLIGSKSIVKAYPEEKVGVFCKKNNKLYIIEYSEMPKDVINLTDENGELVFGEAHIMCNLFNMKALEKIADQELPYHSAHKKVNYIDENGILIKADKPNAYKFEQFIFDGFRYFNDITILRGKREEDFAPIKNKEGIDSPETAIKLYNNLRQ